MLARDRPFRADQLRDSRPVRASVAALRALLAVTLGQLLEARIRKQRREVWAGIEGGKIVESSREGLLQCGESFVFITVSRTCRTEPEIIDARRANAL